MGSVFNLCGTVVEGVGTVVPGVATLSDDEGNVVDNGGTVLSDLGIPVKGAGTLGVASIDDDAGRVVDDIGAVDGVVVDGSVLEGPVGEGAGKTPAFGVGTSCPGAGEDPVMPGVVVDDGGDTLLAGVSCVDDCSSCDPGTIFKFPPSSMTVTWPSPPAVLL